MKKMLWVIALVALTSGPARGNEGGESSYSHLGVGLNVLNMALYSIASSTFDNSTLVPVPFEIHYQPTGFLGVAGTVQIRHHEDGSLDLNELVVCAGPRFRIVGTDLKGLYATVKLGFGFAAGESYLHTDYKRVVFVVHPEIGYAITWGSPSFFLVFGGGVQSQIPMAEIPGSIAWNTMGKLINLYIPTLNITLGVAF